MCGINGFNWNGKNLIKEMNKALKHRGPDDQGTFSDNQMSFSQVRLSIIDLTPAGHQPMFYSKLSGASSEKHNKKNMGLASTKAGIVFNGEIYNYQELKEILENIDEYAPSWMLNYRKDMYTGEDMHLISTDVATRLRDDINMMKMIRSYRGVRHELGLKVRGQRTSSNGRKGLALGVSKRKEAPAATGKKEEGGKEKKEAAK